jgi:hypothetical protein
MNIPTSGMGVIKFAMIAILLFSIIISVLFFSGVNFTVLSPIQQSEDLGKFVLQYGGTLTLSPVLDETASNLTSQELRIIQVVNGHAWLRHSTEANAAFRCLDNHGTWKSYRTYGFKNADDTPVSTNLWLCKDDDGSFYAIITTFFEKIGGNTVARLITAYKVSVDLFPTIQDFISYIVLKWGAREIPYVISQGETILEPFK